MSTYVTCGIKPAATELHLLWLCNMVESTERLGKDNLGIVRLNRDARSRQSPFHSLQTLEKKLVLLLALWWPSIAGRAIPHLGHSVVPLQCSRRIGNCAPAVQNKMKKLHAWAYTHTGDVGRCVAKQGSRWAGKRFTLCCISLNVHLCIFSEERSTDHPLFKIELVVSQQARILNSVFLFFLKLLFCFPFCGKRPSFV